MKKFISLKLIVFSFILVTSAVSYSNPKIEEGTVADSIKAGLKNAADKEQSLAFGYFNRALGKKSSAFGNANIAVGENSSAFGYHNIANNNQSSAFGFGNKSIGEQSSAFGSLNVVGKLKSDGNPDENYGKKSLAFGSEYEVTGNSSGAFGVGHWDTGKYIYKNEGNNSYMIGNKNKIASGSNDNFILGNNVEIGAGVQKSVVLGDGSASGGSNTVSVGSSTLQRKIVNVADGTISATSTDAVTGRQLYSGDGIDVNKWRTRLGVGSGGGAGGGAPVDAYTKSEADNKFANKTDLDNYTKKDDYKDANGIDVDKWKAKLGTGAGSADIQNLRNEVYERIDNVKDEVRDVGSLSAALAGLHPMQYDPKAPAQVMAALGHYKDRQAVAVGASYYFNDRFMMSTGVALSGEKKTKTMANVGFTLKLGKGSGTTYSETPQYVVQNEVKRLTVENQELKERLRNLEQKLEILLKNK
ncbi:CEACAM-binding trimeric autotransporter adhesin CbpF [Fusobacterium nucleatum]|uniref:Hep/Hag repeat protein n=1 Tax=Fusobacterium nucleatum TaxID=851 RepID=A0A133PED0_FUSNU|nr:CEACAM-binding trimeric autotransporter adhesin CbpF [Fusobacterium nucleatum]KXA26840.1 Hep/Hag repeat protein [Fusobacterium nucleatum]